jgi:hypothetical protein
MFERTLDTEHLFVQGERVSRTRVRRRRLACVAMLALALNMGIPVAARAVLHSHDDERRAPARIYVVQPGDTLWAIAAQVAPAADPRIVVDDLTRANDLADGGLVPGRVLQLPATA